jgi:hypothetical protein
MSFGSKTKTTQNSTQTTAIDPQLKARQDQVWQQAQDAAQPYQPFTGQRFEGFNDDQNASFEAARRAAFAGRDTLGRAITGADALAGFTGQQVTPGQAQSFTADPSAAINAMRLGDNALGGPLTAQQASARDVNARSGASGYEQYLNPFTNEVVNTSLGDIERARQEAANATRSQAARAGAFGGSRAGVAESLTNRDFGNTAASTAAGLRQAGFNTALGFNRADQDRELLAAQSNQGADVQTGIANAGNALRAAEADRAQRLSLLQGDQSTDLAAQIRNRELGQDISKFNAGQLQTGDQFNRSLDLRGQEANQAAAQHAAALRLSATGQLGGFAGQQQAMGAQGADLLNRIGGQQQAFGQQQRDFDYQQFLEGQNRPYQNASFLGGILGNQNYGTTQTGNVNTTQQVQQGAGSAILGAGLTLGGAAIAPGGILNKPPSTGGDSLPGGNTAIPGQFPGRQIYNPQGGILDPNRPFGGNNPGLPRRFP